MVVTRSRARAAGGDIGRPATPQVSPIPVRRVKTTKVTGSVTKSPATKRRGVQPKVSVEHTPTKLARIPTELLPSPIQQAAKKDKRNVGPSVQTQMEARQFVRRLLKDGAELGSWVATGEPFAEGAFGLLVKVRGPKDGGEQRAMKIEMNHSHCCVGQEANLLRLFAYYKCPGIPAVLDYSRVTFRGHEVDFHVTTLLGEPLSQRAKRGKMTDAEIKKVGADLLATLKVIHAQSYCHNDIKPDNILWNDRDSRWYLVDFGSTAYLNPNNKRFEGSPAFASTRALENGGWRMDDDLEALYHTLAWCAQGGCLPWENIDLPPGKNITAYKAFAQKRRQCPLSKQAKWLEDFHVAVLASLATPTCAVPEALYSSLV